MTALISAADLYKIHKDKNVRILDGSYGLTPFPQGIEGAVDFDIDHIADPQAPLPHTLPSADVFADLVGKLGISNNDLVVVYDRAGIAMAASRVWWMFRTFGHDNVRVLDGGLPAWVNAGFPLFPKNASPAPAVFKAAFRNGLFKKQQDMLDNIASKKFTVLDARDAARYAGTAAEPRPGITPGHIPGSLSTPFITLVNPDGTLKNEDALKSVINIDLSGPVACTCGSGVTACVVALALHELGHKDAAVYGGSWTEWGGDPALPKKQGGTP